MLKETVILVDENDVEIGHEEKIVAHQKALCHRAFSVFILNKEKKILLQKRHSDKYHCAGLWSNTCCGHPRPGEITAAAAARRLSEETGICTELHDIGRFHYTAVFDNGLTENEVDHVFHGLLTQDRFIINGEEIEDIRWASLEELVHLLDRYPQQFTPWLLPALALLKKILRH